MTLLEGRRPTDEGPEQDHAPGEGAEDVPFEEFVYVAPSDPRALPLLTELEREYNDRYGDIFGEPASEELNRYPEEEFLEPKGAFLLLLRDGVAIAGGAFKTYDERTTELKRIWASSEHRRQGLAKRVVIELEDESRRRGFTRSYLTTGPRQPEAVRLYLATGWTPLFDVTRPPEQVGIHGFAKSLTTEALDLPDIQSRHDADQAEFLAENPSFGAALEAGLEAGPGAALEARPAVDPEPVIEAVRTTDGSTS
ncbi:GNAT family N-acetyltransferase [Plantibacter sp. Mn2098]|uniref:GNAT family N-acetyltransferase n=1 Tax=Plantibacter sp. Mn2098 TaxID=3395266 RepID=UPI003BBDF374